MAKIRELLAAGQTLSFEFFPPRNERPSGDLEKTLRRARAARARFVSVTYGAGGSTRDETPGDRRAHPPRHLDDVPMAHLTCVAHTRPELAEIVAELPRGGHREPPRPRRRPAARGRRRRRATSPTPSSWSSWCGSSATSPSAWPPIPELHPRSPDRDDRPPPPGGQARSWPTSASPSSSSGPRTTSAWSTSWPPSACDTPVLPGIIPVTNARPGRALRRAGRRRRSRPSWPSGSRRWPTTPTRSAASASRWPPSSARTLLDGGAPGLHFYTLNRSTATREIYATLGLGPPLSLAAGP